ncbi:MAG: nucleotidyltransferase [Bacteroidales bacterium]|nr:nucleotidyltransferase [Bacteroidales bacterium]
MKPTLVVLAAGMGSRYGGLKQMDGLGPNNETIIDYSIYDAVRAGFGKVVYIVRDYFKEQFQDTVKKKYSSVRCIDGSPLEFQFVTQELDKIPAGYVVNPERVKPWGTAHALLMAAEAVGEPFAVINGDDYYGRDSFQILADWLRQRENSTGEYCIVGFKLENTLSESGGVSRGICSYDKDNNLIDVVEHHMIAREADGEIRGDNSVTLEHVLLNGSDLCSMNMWGFTPDYFEKSAVIFDSFLAAHSNELKSEFYIPYAVDQMIKKGGDKCTVLCTPSRWFGVTYQQDRPGVVAKFEQLVKDGIYPSPLYENKN